MKTTVEKILNNMKKAYFDETGKEIAMFSDTDNRLKAAAAELYAVYTYADYIFKQAFVQTAAGKYLDYHAELRGLERKKASKAEGSLSFALNEPVENDVIIPKGTVCSVSERPFIQFITEEAAVIKAGELSAQASAAALSSGCRFNAAANEITNIVNPPKFVSSVTNISPFTGGTDDESDEGLRERLLNVYKYESNALNEASVKNIVIGCDGVMDAYIFKYGSYIEVCMKTPKNNIAYEMDILKAVSGKLTFFELLGIDCIYSSAIEKKFNVSVDIKAYSGADFDKVRKAVEDCVTDYCKKEKIGAEISEADIAMAAAGIDFTDEVNVFLTPSVSGSVSCGTKEFLKLADLQVTVHG